MVPNRPGPEDAEPGCKAVPRFDSFHYQIHAETHMNDISVIYTVIPERLTQYCDRPAVIEL
jgi:hypothetical protein